jgi:hypothetical protein
MKESEQKMTQKMKVIKCKVYNAEKQKTCDLEFLNWDDLVSHLWSDHADVLDTDCRTEDLAEEVIYTIDEQSAELLKSFDDEYPKRNDLPDQEESSPAGPRTPYTPGQEFTDHQPLPNFKPAEKKIYPYGELSDYGEDAYGKEFKCKCGLRSSDFGKFIRHVKKEHPEDFRAFLTESIKSSLVRNHAKTHPTELWTDEFIQRQTAKLVENALANLSAEEREEADQLLKVFGQFDLAKEWLTGKSDACPICHLSYDAGLVPQGAQGIGANLRNKSGQTACPAGVMQTKILLCAKRDIPEYSNMRFGAVDNFGQPDPSHDLRHRKFDAKWKGQECLVDLGAFTHMAVNHETSFKFLVENQMLSGPLVDFVMSLYEPQKKLEALTKKEEETFETAVKHLKKGNVQETKGVPSEQSGVQKRYLRDEYRRDK